MTITVATAECFTHGIIAREIHACTQGYQGEFGPQVLKPESLKNFQDNVILLCGMFIPTLSALKSVLKVDPPKPHKIINGIKVYHEKEDQEVALLMARAVKKISGADVGIGTTAGIGRGGISIVTQDKTVRINSDEYADLCSPNSEQLLSRQRSGVKKTLILLEQILNQQ
ncbi:FeGP cofactor biosynthesis protein HcgF family protein [Methanobacterium petrolearium]|jgi:uncharacterized protein (UPF0254 family)|uniref:FeGP cofactor biosynthesis protein HcgF family protein n=1 Tax=Methanobacterium petrolearium TaxID=710190 RepID=UPI0009D4918C|nr:FeGP cofactor biosynthesis protein HcgF family protein [Methanobacterium petrolearium]MBP1946038.1 uncharacterized protein (UPF0254 family) [Methanobacterium petrolearium]OPX59688.1 MAG: hypothetical protein A4E25_01175 [Methanobacterium sp. PtaB.Bin024]BDZ70827.1 hypothetical protein GCM10025861_13440 [Methanobacterium petrolearium]